MAHATPTSNGRQKGHTSLTIGPVAPTVASVVTGVTEVATPAMLKELTVTARVLTVGVGAVVPVQPAISPLPSSFMTHASLIFEPNAAVIPAEIYPPSEVCWIPPG